MTKASPKRKALRPTCGYAGYRVQTGDTIATVGDLAEIRTHYIGQRRPAKLSIPRPIEAEPFRLQAIVGTLDYNEPLQVERKVLHGFGLGKQRERMSFAEVVDRLKGGDDSWYLTTQYEGGSDGEGEDAEISAESPVSGSDDSEHESNFASAMGREGENAGASSNSEEDSDFEVDFDNLHDDYASDDGDDGDDAYSRVKTLFQPPLTNLAKKTGKKRFPITPEPFENLYTQQINLWMGASCPRSTQPDFLSPTLESLGRYVPKGNSSGLHHDHADNLYYLVEGRKRFTLFSPDNAEKLATVGDINKVYENGLIDYQVNKNARFWRPMRADGAILAEWAHYMLEKEDFGSHSESYLRGLVENEPTYTGEELPLDPPSFSKIPPIFLHLEEVDPADRPALEALCKRHFPELLNLKKIEVWLEPGDLLYIPVGWFHEVTSFSGEETAHVALNWWFVPPVGTLEKPYDDNYWKDDFAVTMQAVAEVQK